MKKAKKYKKKQASKTKVAKQPNGSHRWSWHYLIVLLLPVILYANTIGHGYVYDDVIIIVNNDRITAGIKGIPNLFTQVVSFEGKSRLIYRPISYMTHAFEWQLFGNNPTPSHIINILLYALCCLLVYLFLRKLLHKHHPLYAFFITLLFIVHPTHIESVANIKGRDDVISLILVLGSLFYFFKYLDTKVIKWGGLSIFLFALGLLAKETVLTFLVIYPLLAYYYLDNWKYQLKEIGLVTISIVLVPIVLFLIGYSQGNITASNLYSFVDNPIIAAQSVGERWASTILVWGYYLKLLVIPYPLVYYYGYNHIPLTTFADYRVWLTLALVIGLAIYSIKMLFKKNWTALGLLFLAITLSIFAHLVLGGAILAERYLFIPSLGFSMAIVTFVFNYLSIDFRKSWKHQSPLTKGFLAFFTGILIVFSLIIIDRNRDWKSNLSLLKNDIHYLNNAARAHSDLAITMLNINPELYQADILKHLQQSRDLHESAYIYRHLGEAYYTFKDSFNAEENFLNALAINPNNKRANLYLGYNYYNDRKFKMAIPYFEKAIQLYKAEAHAYTCLARSYCRQTNPQGTDYMQALQIIKKGLQLFPENTNEFLKDKGRILILQGNYQEALKIYTDFEKSAPHNRDIIEALYKIYIGLGDEQKAAFYGNKLQ